jgi:hypothetical protein
MAGVNFTGTLSLADSIVLFVPDSIQLEKRFQISSFVVRIQRVEKSFIGNSNPTTILLKDKEATYLFFVSIPPSDTLIFQNVFINTLKDEMTN